MSRESLYIRVKYVISINNYLFKKMEKINLQKISTSLTDGEMKMVTGGSMSTTCGGLSKDHCSGPCNGGLGYPDNNYCGWVNPKNACKCATGGA
jgi:hypothetical protein